MTEKDPVGTPPLQPQPDARLTELSRINIGFPKNRNEWQEAPAVITAGGNLEILRHPVMEQWEKPYMEALAAVACRNGGRILEVGFGLGISAGFIQLHEITEHMVIEANQAVFELVREFTRAARHPVTPLLGFWEEVCPTLPAGSFDGILFDTYPLRADELHCNHFVFFAEAYRLLRPGGVFTYYSDEPEWFGPEHLEALKQAGFYSITGETCAVTPPPDCLYWRHSTILTPIITKKEVTA